MAFIGFELGVSLASHHAVTEVNALPCRVRFRPTNEKISTIFRGSRANTADDE